MGYNKKILDMNEDEIRDKFDNADRYAEALADEHIETITDNSVITRKDINRDQFLTTLRSMINEDEIWNKD